MGFRRLETVVDRRHVRVGLRVEHVQHDSAAVAIGLDAVSFGQNERMTRQGVVVHGMDRAVLVLGLFWEQGMKSKHGHGRYSVPAYSQ